jgi:hypothetical protein
VELALESAVCVGRVGVHLFLCISSVSADFFQYHFSKEGSRTCGFEEVLPGDFVSQPSLFYAQETEHPASSRLGPRRIVSP